MNEQDHADATLSLRFVARISGTKYDAEANRDARHRITAFFDTHLRSSCVTLGGSAIDHTCTTPVALEVRRPNIPLDLPRG